MSRLGDRLKELRGDLSLYEVEQATGIARKWVSLYETSKYIPPIENLKKLAEYYEVSYRELRFLYFDDLYQNPEEKELIIRWVRNTPEGL